MGKATLGFRTYKIWQILKRFCQVISSSINLSFLKSAGLVVKDRGKTRRLFLNPPCKVVETLPKYFINTWN